MTTKTKTSSSLEKMIAGLARSLAMLGLHGRCPAVPEAEGEAGASGHTPDRLLLRDRSDIARLLDRLGAGDEQICFSDQVFKINHRGREQSRIMMVTDKAVYNIKPTVKYTRCQRRIKLEDVVAVTTSSSSEFVLHVPEQYDYRLKAANPLNLIDSISLQHRKLTKKKLPIRHVHDPVLKQHTLTKRKARRLTRQDIMQRRRRLACEDYDVDGDDDCDFGLKTSHLANSKEKVCLDDFDLLKVVGRGSFGKVMLVREKLSGKTFAMKVLKKSAIIARNQVEHTKSERRILQNISHPFLMRLEYAFQTKEKLYLILTYYKGGELFFHLKHMRRFSEEIARFFIAQIALAIGHLHEYQIVYRDLKPENILMDEFGNICLTDFGLSKGIECHDKAHTFAGTPEYLSPEVVSGSGHGKAVDWWSLGILLYELTVGIPPFYSQNLHEMYQKIQSGPLRFPPFLSGDCKDLLTKLLERDPEQRLGSGETDIDELRVHPFFNTINWEKMLLKDLSPPYIPILNAADNDTSNFDSQFTSEPAVDSLVAESVLPPGSHGFDQFTFIGPTHL